MGRKQTGNKNLSIKRPACNNRSKTKLNSGECTSAVLLAYLSRYNPHSMNKKGPIVVIEDDPDDQMLLGQVFRELALVNEIVYFSDGEAALGYLRKPEIYPFLILSDVNMPRLDGFKLKEMVHTNEQLSTKCIPYLFFTTAVNKKAVYDAYTMSAQGFFLKPDNYKELVDTISVMISYWQRCYSPSNFAGEPRHFADESS